MTKFTKEKKTKPGYVFFIPVRSDVDLFVFQSLLSYHCSFILSVLVRNWIAAALSLSSTMLHGLLLRNAIHFLSLYSPLSTIVTHDQIFPHGG